MSWQVHFYRRVLGVPFAVPRGSVEIRLARDEARAIEAAKRRFARRKGIEDWTLLADDFDIVCPGPERIAPDRVQAPA